MPQVRERSHLCVTLSRVPPNAFHASRIELWTLTTMASYEDWNKLEGEDEEEELQDLSVRVIPVELSAFNICFHSGLKEKEMLFSFASTALSLCTS
jgi:hypothetical protein